ncbi:MAG: hypothetical protein MJ105_02980 [Lachnospiraceae bacterium]|nr:hypothetical protein [Lachnospiraceae bacterium]
MIDVSVFQKDDIRSTDLVLSVFRSVDNYKIIDTGAENARCLLCFAGNLIYYPNEENAFRKSILEEDRFEYENITSDKKIRNHFGRIIYFRDVYKQWYMSGLNKDYDSLDKFLSLLAELTKGYEVYTMGNSAGGFMAMLAGCYLHAKCVYSFSGQFDLWHVLDAEPVLSAYKEDESFHKYYNLQSLLEESQTVVYYFQPAQCKIDVKQYAYVQDIKNVIRIPFATDQHGASINSASYKYVLTMADCKKDKLFRKIASKGKMVSHVSFMFMAAGVIKASMEVIKKSIGKSK